MNSTLIKYKQRYQKSFRCPVNLSKMSSGAGPIAATVMVPSGICLIKKVLRVNLKAYSYRRIHLSFISWRHRLNLKVRPRCLLLRRSFSDLITAIRSMRFRPFSPYQFWPQFVWKLKGLKWQLGMPFFRGWVWCPFWPERSFYSLPQHFSSFNFPNINFPFCFNFYLSFCLHRDQLQYLVLTDSVFWFPGKKLIFKQVVSYPASVLVLV